jgi:hypothetical protein
MRGSSWIVVITRRCGGFAWVDEPKMGSYTFLAWPLNLGIERLNFERTFHFIVSLILQARSLDYKKDKSRMGENGI